MSQVSPTVTYKTDFTKNQIFLANFSYIYYTTKQTVYNIGKLAHEEKEYSDWFPKWFEFYNTDR